MSVVFERCGQNGRIEEKNENEEKRIEKEHVVLKKKKNKPKPKIENTENAGEEDVINDNPGKSQSCIDKISAGKTCCGGTCKTKTKTESNKIDAACAKGHGEKSD